MTSEQFVYWLQGFVELTNKNQLPSQTQWRQIQDHLQLVFKKETPFDKGVLFAKETTYPIFEPESGTVVPFSNSNNFDGIKQECPISC